MVLVCCYLRVRRTKHVGNDGSLFTQAMKRPSALNQGLDALLGKFDDLRIDVAVGPGLGMDHWCNDILSELGCHCREVRTRRVVLERMREQQDLPDEGPICDNLCAPVLGSQPCTKDVVCWRIVLSECKTRCNPVHPRHRIRDNPHVPELVLSIFAGIFGRIEHAVNAVQMSSQVQLPRITVENSLVEALKQAHVGMRHVIFVRKQAGRWKLKFRDEITIHFSMPYERGNFLLPRALTSQVADRSRKSTLADCTLFLE